ncbi:Uncharacterized protein FWK35_00032672 [Aphis craccivora]|uniref:Uncharacterized protein n=1 Tax=Aphis craccivora TaxID=307492 RepID=A0A6G0Y5N5_APHCR|nr:Uncharacterized protein FWK35_00032672 [Aphis craccivora]
MDSASKSDWEKYVEHTEKIQDEDYEKEILKDSLLEPIFTFASDDRQNAENICVSLRDREFRLLPNPLNAVQGPGGAYDAFDKVVFTRVTRCNENVSENNYYPSAYTRRSAYRAQQRQNNNYDNNIITFQVVVVAWYLDYCGRGRKYAAKETGSTPCHRVCARACVCDAGLFSGENVLRRQSVLRLLSSSSACGYTVNRKWRKKKKTTIGHKFRRDSPRVPD